MVMNIVIITAVAVSAPIAFYVATKRGIVRQHIGYVKNRLSMFSMEKKCIDKVEELRIELTNLREYVEKYKEKIDIVENQLHSLEERIEFIDKKLSSLDTAQEEDDIVLKVIDLRKKGYSLKRIAEELNISLSKVRKILKDNAVD
ncbi:MAG: helix-turn-helix domain-containing protein [Ignisphaera sp.]